MSLKELTHGFNEVENILAKTIEYLTIPAVVGHEQFFLNYLYEDYQKLGLEVYKFPGLLEVHGSKPMQAIICAHIDRHGLISLGKGEYVYAAQYIREIKYGENNKSSQAELASIGQRFAGEKVFAYNPNTCRKLGNGIIEICHPHMRAGDAIFNVQGMRDLRQNIPLAYARTAKEVDGHLRGQIDNAISIGVINALFKSGFPGTVLFTTEEEIGKSWIHIANWLEQAHIETKDLIILDTSPYTDQIPLEEGMVILRNRDKSEIFNAGLVAQLKRRCDQIGIPYQVKDEYLIGKGKTESQLGSTELGRLIQGKEGRWSGATVQIPTLMYHTSNETTSRAAIKNYFRILQSILIKDPLLFKNRILAQA